VKQLIKPDHVFDRTAEWTALSAFATTRSGPGRLGVVSGRRRQGKTFLLDALAGTTGGFYFVASEDTEVETLRRFGEALAQHTSGGGQLALRTWDDAIERMYALLRDQLIVIDEFPYLLRSSPALASLLQKALDAGGVAHKSDARLLLCGSAMAVMGGLLAGNAPLRGRASLELVVRPMDYRTAAQFWEIDDPKLAILVHSIVGGTPAYRHEFTNSDRPADTDDFDAWVIRTVLNPAVPLFREARYLLAEETGARDPALYHSVLGAIADGNATRGGIASYLERPSVNIGHPLQVLEDCGLISKEADAFRPNRSAYRIDEPLITFYSAVMRRAWTFLDRGLAEQAWELSRQTFLSKVVGPHFETLCREYALRNAVALFGALPSLVAAGTVADPDRRTQIDIDVAVLGEADAVLCLGEAKWGTRMGIRHLDRLRRARDLLAVRGLKVAGAKLMCFGAAGFADDLRAAQQRGEVTLIDPERLYRDGASEA
jgi:AAA+ ATPase superfamily predicted ATPase